MESKTYQCGRFSRKGKPVERRGHKANGPYRKADGGRAAKGGLRMKKVRVYAAIVAILVLLSGFGKITSARELARAELKVRIQIPVMQRLTVLQPAEVVFAHPQNGQPLVFTDVGRVRVQSNANWALAVGAVGGSDVDISVRPSGDRMASWQSVDGYGPVYTGPNGSQDISWDVMIRSRSAKAVRSGNEQGMVNLYFTLGEI